MIAPSIDNDGLSIEAFEILGIDSHISKKERISIISKFESSENQY